MHNIKKKRFSMKKRYGLIVMTGFLIGAAPFPAFAVNINADILKYLDYSADQLKSELYLLREDTDHRYAEYRFVDEPVTEEEKQNIEKLYHGEGTETIRHQWPLEIDCTEPISENALSPGYVNMTADASKVFSGLEEGTALTEVMQDLGNPELTFEAYGELVFLRDGLIYTVDAGLVQTFVERFLTEEEQSEGGWGKNGLFLDGYLDADELEEMKQIYRDYQMTGKERITIQKYDPVAYSGIGDPWQLLDGQEQENVKNGWLEEDGIWRYYENNAYVTGAKYIDGFVYYFKPEDGSMVQSSFYEINGNTYYFDDNGHSVRDWVQIDRNGVLCWHYFTNAGIMARGWQQIGDYWYYFKEDGTMVHSTNYVIDGEEYLFDANGHMLDGWQNVNGSNRFYNPVPTDFVFKQGENVSTEYLLNHIREKSAAETLGGYSMAGEFINDISEWEKFSYAVKNWKDELGAIFAGTLDPDNSIVNHYMNEEAGCKAYLRAVLGELCDNEDLKLIPDTASQEMDIKQELAKRLGYTEFETLLDVFDKGTEAAEATDRIFTDYSKNIELLNRLRSCVPDGSVLANTIGQLILDYENQVFKEVRDISVKEGGKYLIKSIDALVGTKISSVDKMIGLIYQNTSDLDAIDDVIYSSALKAEAISALRTAENRLLSSGGDEEALLDYTCAFQIANGIVKKQYEEMLTYYQEKSNPSAYREKIRKLEEAIGQLKNQSFFSY